MRVLKKPFREAHHIAGSIVKLAEDKGVALDKLPLADMQAVEPGITQDVLAVLSLESSVNSRMSLGGTAPARVKEQIAYLAGAPEMKAKAILLVIALGLLAASCGVKNDLTKPDGTTTPRDTHDPSKPPYPIGR